jgi:hypothetical protein
MIDLAATNNFKSLAPEIRAIANDTKNSALARKATRTLEKLGIS